MSNVAEINKVKESSVPVISDDIEEEDSRNKSKMEHGEPGVLEAEKQLEIQISELLNKLR